MLNRNLPNLDQLHSVNSLYLQMEEENAKLKFSAKFVATNTVD